MGSKELHRVKRELADLGRQHRQMTEKITRLEHMLTSLSDKQAAGPTPAPQEKTQDQIPIQEISNKQVTAEKNLEFRIGGTWFNRIGVVAVILGLAFFLKYAFDNDWIGPMGRVLMGISGGLVMLVAGEKLRLRYPGYAQGLTGGGNLALFVSVYAAYEFFRLIAPPHAFVFLIVVMANTVFMAVMYNSLPIGVLGIIGGFLIPPLIGTTDPSVWPLVTYLIILTSGVLAVSLYKRWALFQYLSFLFNQVFMVYIFIQFLWGYHRAANLIPLFTYLIAVFLLYLGVATIHNLLHKKKARGLDIALVTINAFLFLIWSLTLLEHTPLNYYLGFYTLLLALLYIFLGQTAYRIFPKDRLLAYSLFTISFVFVTVAIPLQLEGAYIGIAWLAEAIGLLYIARRLQYKKAAYAGLAVLALGLISTYHHLQMLWYYNTFVFNFPTLILLSSLAAILLAARFTSEMEGLGFRAGDALKGLFLLQVFIGLTVQNHHYFTLHYREFFISPEQLSLSGLWLLYAIVLFSVGLRKSNRHLRYSSLGLLAIIILKAFFVDLSNLDTMFRIFLFIILGLSLLGISFIYQKKKDTLQKEGEDA